MSGSGLEALPVVREWSGCHRGCPGVVGSPFRLSVSRRDAPGYVKEWLGVPPRCLGVFGRPFRMSGSSREALPV